MKLKEIVVDKYQGHEVYKAPIAKDTYYLYRKSGSTRTWRGRRYMVKTKCVQCGEDMYQEKRYVMRSVNGPFCSVGCRNTFYPLQLEKNPKWNGGKSIEQGYVFIRHNGSGMREHRFIAEKVLGRPLTKDETIHHINMDKTDNRNCNLMICDRSYHMWLHSRMARAWVERVGL